MLLLHNGNGACGVAAAIAVMSLMLLPVMPPMATMTAVSVLEGCGCKGGVLWPLGIAQARHRHHGIGMTQARHTQGTCMT